MLSKILMGVILSGFLTYVCAQGSSDQEALRKYADQIGLNFGVAIGNSFGNSSHDNIVKKDFNTVVAENSMKAASLHSSRGRPNFSQADRMVKFAEENKMKIRGHTLVWYNQNASWITSGSRSQILENMKFHIETVMEHFKGKVFQWDVVNEAFADDGGNLRNSEWSKAGADYIDSAFVYAHRADPEARLFYNDYSTSTINTKSTAIYNMIKKMLQNGIPIHGIGFQCHQSTSDGNSSTFYTRIRENFQRFADLGLEIAITELDAKGSDFDAQAKVYSTYMRIALEMPAVTTYMIWGVRDQDSWVNPTPLIFDNSWKPKKAYYAILEVLKDTSFLDPQSVLTDRRAAASITDGILAYNKLTNSLTLTGTTPGESKLIEFFNLSGKKTASCFIPANRSLPVSSVNVPAGTMLVRSGNQAIKIQKLQ